MSKTLAGKVVFISGASRGIGRSIALRAARDGASVAIAAKTAAPHQVLPGTIHSVAKEIEEAGGRALPCQVDVRDETAIQRAMEETAETFGGIDILVNNASAIFLAGTEKTPLKRFDLMHQVNVRATFACSQLALPFLAKGENPHILNLSPPLSLDRKWYVPHVAYTMSKMGMSLCVLAMAEEFADKGIAVNALWPKTAIATEAIRHLLGAETVETRCRKPDIVSDAAHAILVRGSGECTGNFFIDEDVLEEEGVSDLSRYSVTPGADLLPDFFV